MSVCEPWAVPADLCCDISGYDPLLVDEAILNASQFLDELTNSRFGVCEYVLRPCVCLCLSKVCCCELRKIRLEVPFGKPIRSVTSVTVWDQNGVETVVDSNLYRVTPNFMVFSDSWPFGFKQNLNNTLGEADTWSVVVEAGETIPFAGRYAVADLACELLKRCDDSCKLPIGVSSTSRDGVTISYRDDSFHVSSVDLFLQSFNPASWSGIITDVETLTF